MEALLKQHQRLVHSVLRQQWRGAVACADLLQEGRIGLWQAVMHFDSHRGVAFSTYAWTAIERRMWRAVRMDSRRREQEDAWTQRTSSSTWSEPPNPLPMAEDTLWWEVVCATLFEMVARLPEPLREVVIVFYGLDGGPPRTLAALGRWYGVTGEMVRVWRNEALVQLRMPLYSARLRQWCGQNSRKAVCRQPGLESDGLRSHSHPRHLPW